jgi:hypothetical protein
VRAPVVKAIVAHPCDSEAGPHPPVRGPTLTVVLGAVGIPGRPYTSGDSKLIIERQNVKNDVASNTLREEEHELSPATEEQQCRDCRGLFADERYTRCPACLQKTLDAANALSTEVDRRIARGAALLDASVPGWDTEIDLAWLNLEDHADCILGQVFDSSTFAVELLRLDDPAYYGFDLASDEDETAWPALSDRWHALILARRAPS